MYILKLTNERNQSEWYKSWYSYYERENRDEAVNFAKECLRDGRATRAEIFMAVQEITMQTPEPQFTVSPIVPETAYDWFVA